MKHSEKVRELVFTNNGLTIVDVSKSGSALEERGNGEPVQMLKGAAKRKSGRSYA
jgi:hypothetical protein